MKTQHEIDESTLAIVRRVDPLEDPRIEAETGVDTEAALRSVLAQLDRSAPVRRPRPQRRLQLGVLATAGAAALLVVGINVGSSGSGVSPASAQAATIKAQALRALVADPGSISVGDVETGQVNSNHQGNSSWSYLYWASPSSPHAYRIIEKTSGVTAESALTPDGYQELYDPSSNIIYRYAPQFDFSTSASGTVQVTVPSYQLETNTDTANGATLPAGDTGTTTLTVTAAEVTGLKTGAYGLTYQHMAIDQPIDAMVDSEPVVQQQSVGPVNPATQWTREVRQLLGNPASTVDRSATYEGSPAIEITGVVRLDGGTPIPTSYYVTPGDYRPLKEVQTSVAHIRSQPPILQTITSTFPTFKTLTGSDVNPDLLSLTAQHPTAQAQDADQARWTTLQAELYPNG